MKETDLLKSDIPEYYTKKTIVFGCGNILFGDDGFGPKVIEYYQKHFEVPEDTYFLDIGTSIRNILFNLVISEERPENIIIVDAVDVNKKPGEIFEIDIEGIPANKIHDFSLHQVPTINLLKELRDLCNINVIIITCQIEHIPAEVQPGLSDSLENAIPEMCKAIQLKIKELK